MQSSSSPFAVLIGGGSGTGKSTVALEAARQVHADRLVSTDILRIAMRAVTTPESRSELFRESFEGDRDDISNFLEQATPIAGAATDALRYCASQGWNIVMEGVHLVPGLVAFPDAVHVSFVLLVVTDEQRHASRFTQRQVATVGGRPADVYLANLNRIRAVQERLMACALAYDVPVIENESVTSTVKEIRAVLR